MADYIPDLPIDPPECWEITPCERCPDEGTPACPKYIEEEEDVDNWDFTQDNAYDGGGPY